MVPLDALVTVERVSAPTSVDRFNIFPAAKILGSPAPGFSLRPGDRRHAAGRGKQTLPRRLSPSAGPASAYQEIATAGSGNLGFIFGLIMVFLILAAQYERWSLPLAVLTAVPFALFGAHRSRSGCAVWTTTSISRSG